MMKFTALILLLLWSLLITSQGYAKDKKNVEDLEIAAPITLPAKYLHLPKTVNGIKVDWTAGDVGYFNTTAQKRVNSCAQQVTNAIEQVSKELKSKGIDSLNVVLVDRADPLENANWGLTIEGDNVVEKDGTVPDFEKYSMAFMDVIRHETAKNRGQFVPINTPGKTLSSTIVEYYAVDASMTGIVKVEADGTRSSVDRARDSLLETTPLQDSKYDAEETLRLPWHHFPLGSNEISTSEDVQNFPHLQFMKKYNKKARPIVAYKLTRAYKPMNLEAKMVPSATLKVLTRSEDGCKYIQLGDDDIRFKYAHWQRAHQEESQYVLTQIQAIEK